MTNHELANGYRAKSRLLGEDKLEIKLLDGDRVELVGVKDKEDTGRLVIPSFITEIGCDVTNDLVVGSVLSGSRYEEVYVDNKGEIGLRGLCSNMKSKRLKVWVRDISKITDMSYMFNSCESLEYVRLGRNKTINLKRVINMFNGCKELKVIDMGDIWLAGLKKDRELLYIFKGCNKLERVILDKHIGDVYVISFLVSGAGCDRGIIELV